ncbi:MAG TPA: PspC domain-containing protein [Gaiellaceae bacterium]|nr:PspC domain-containing protein [Gaiellaceae bacterium]
MNAPTETIPAAEPRRLTRDRDDRWLGGVCGGLGRYFDLNPVVYRIAFAALALAGGTGILLYVAAWLVIPDEGVEDSIAAEHLKRNRDRPWLVVGVALLAAGGLLALSEAHVWPSPGNLWLAAAIGGAAIVWWQVNARRHESSAPVASAAAPAAIAKEPKPRKRSLLPVAAGLLILGLGVVGLLDATGVTDVDWRVALAIGAIGLGVIIAVGALTGRAVGGVVVLAVGVLAALALAFAVRVPLFSGVGNEVESPSTIAAVHSTYEHGIGNVHVNLQEVAFPVGRTKVKTTLGIGNLTVRVPEDVTVDVNGRASAGDVRLLGHEDSGTDVHSHVVEAGTHPLRVLVLDARVGLGALKVIRG